MDNNNSNEAEKLAKDLADAATYGFQIAAMEEQVEYARRRKKAMRDFQKSVDEIAEHAIMRVRACAAEEQREQMCAPEKHTTPCDFCKDNRLGGLVISEVRGDDDVKFVSHAVLEPGMRYCLYNFCPICGRKL